MNVVSHANQYLPALHGGYSHIPSNNSVSCTILSNCAPLISLSPFPLCLGGAGLCVIVRGTSVNQLHMIPGVSFSRGSKHGLVPLICRAPDRGVLNHGSVFWHCLVLSSGSFALLIGPSFARSLTNSPDDGGDTCTPQIHQQFQTQIITFCFLACF